ncbi:uncharacterized protein LOC113291248 [Papaver somniferum]|uniref:uncharacterized protein LOC113291248 n=1 Tax=Papaver somniferum TaxID=3469 RepID=UPI000E6FF5D5|nr:uncharacterized protein LOC113291248 [Papaver somniferum]
MRQGSDLILERLDRCFFNQIAEDLCPNFCVNNFPRDSSDHCPMHIGFNYEDICMPRPFYFMAMWMEDPTCRDIIVNSWSVNVVGSPAYKLKSKLLSTKKGLRDWNKTSFGNIQTNISTIRKDLADLQCNNPTETTLTSRLKDRLEYLYNLKELYWKDKSRDDEILADLPIKFTAEDNALLSLPLTAEEIKNAVSKWGGGGGSPGPDGFTGLLYQKNWDIVGESFIDMTQTCFRIGNIAKPQPERGLGQGCSEALSSYIDYLQSKATTQNFQVIKSYLQKYCLASGQEINFEKYGILFSRRIPEHMKAILANILDIQSRYLGEIYRTPTVFQASKVETHMVILQAVDAIISIWLHKLLSQAAITTLIKHSGQAIPLFQMGAFLIPKHLCKLMDSHLCKFWWGETLDPKDRKLHLLGWDILCSPKAEGGLGFRKAELNNLSMMARNAWRILEHPDFLLPIVLKAKYFPNTDFLNAKCPSKSSWTWKCLHAIKELIKLFISWIVGYGQFIDPWCDKWIPTLGSATPNLLVPPDPIIKVSYFIDTQTKSWNLSRLNTHFDNASVHKIFSLPLSQVCTPDGRAWDLSKNGKFSSKSAYTGLRGLRPSHCKNLWKRIWKIRVPYRI